jgi:DNA-binding response OmpR family regulator
MILIIEPSIDLASLIKRRLNQDGFEAMTCHTSQQGIMAADKTSLEAIIIELLMPKHNGLEFIYEFRSYFDWHKIPIIIYSQLSQEELGLNPSLKREMGIFEHLYKPTNNLDKLSKVVSKALKK